MKTMKLSWVAKASITACMLTGLAITSSAMADVVVIVNTANAASIDEEQIAKIFLGQTKTFSNGSEAIPIDQKEGPVREEFGNKLLKKNPAQLKAQWARQILPVVRNRQKKCRATTKF